ncbi:MAG: hypothetical protein IT162_11255 [Bryobacterales bacterium]|nr:hypothetical protein [Bryobacterales bacterium]
MKLLDRLRAPEPVRGLVMGRRVESAGPGEGYRICLDVQYEFEGRSCQIIVQPGQPFATAAEARAELRNWSIGSAWTVRPERG